MYYRIALVGISGQAIAFDGTMGYIAHDVEGLGQPAATVPTTAYAGIDGSYLGNPHVTSRNIVIPYQFLSGVQQHVAELRWQLYNEFQVGEAVTVKVHCWRGDYQIDGVIESMDESRYDNPSGGQISIICVSPCWLAEKTTVLQMQETEGGMYAEYAITVNNRGASAPFSVAASMFNSLDDGNGKLPDGIKLTVQNGTATQELTLSGDAISNGTELHTVLTIDNEGHEINTYDNAKNILKDYTDRADDPLFLTLNPGSNIVTWTCPLRSFQHVPSLYYTQRLWGV